MEKLKKRWGIDSNFQIAIIFIVFAITGSSAAKLAEPLCEFIGLHRASTASWLYWTARILLIFPICSYQICVQHLRSIVVEGVPIEC